ncbi:MAG TPA: virulence factor, partial [Caldilineaceae bacterium]|nr:virulence factor [Caldilineaceae bacterium]
RFTLSVFRFTHRSFMAEFQITYWRNIPSLVTAREGRRNTAKVELPQRFQLAIDDAAMRLGLTGTDAYLEAWHRSPWQTRVGTPQEVAAAIAAETEAAYPPERLRELLRDR